MKILIVTSGPTQLIYQFALLKKLSYSNSENYVVILYNGLYNKSIEIFFKQISDINNFKFVGCINYNIRPNKSSGKILRRFLSKIRLIKKTEHLFPLLKRIRKSDIVIIPVRVKVLSDISLLTYLKTKEIFFTADGVFDEIPNRNFNNKYYKYLNNSLKKFPLDDKIYSPNHLKTDVEKIGLYQEINVEDEFQKLSNIDMYKNFKQKYLQGKVSCVIISQHYHLHESVSYEDDISYFSSIIEYFIKKGFENIMFKPHPRDTKEKIDLFLNKFKEKINVIENHFQALPLEAFQSDFIKMNTIFVTGNSSAPLFFKKSNKILSVYSSRYLSDDLNSKIKMFSSKYDIESIEINL